MQEVIGHSTQRASLKRLRENGVLPHALLFTGPAGTGKSLVARELACDLLSDLPSEGSTREAVQAVIDAGNHPDFIWVECSESEKASTKEIRTLLHSLHLKSFSSPNRVVVLNDVHFLNAQALNSILKSLEEPRPGTYFILVTSRPNQLLRTIVSRCQAWSFHPLEMEEVRQILSAQPEALPPEQLAVLATIADGSLENVNHLREHLGDWQRIRRSLLQISLGDKALAIRTAREIGKDKDSAKRSLHMIRILARQRMQDAEEREASLQWASLLQGILKAQEAIELRNLNTTYVLQALLWEFAQGGPIHSLEAGTIEANTL